MAGLMFSIVIPVYRNEASLEELVLNLGVLANAIRQDQGLALQVIFVVDGSPDNCYFKLASILGQTNFKSKLILHSRNFGAFAAIRTGMATADGAYIGVMAADLQEPLELMLEFAERLVMTDCDVVIGRRSGREDHFVTRWLASMFWRFNRAFINKEMPASGVDVFACTRRFKEQLLALDEANTSLVGLVYWMGFRRQEVAYTRLARKYGRSAWSFRKKFNYLLDSVYAFTDLPIKLLTLAGLIGLAAAALFGGVILYARLMGGISVPGYAAIVLAVLFFGGLNALGLGIVGSYAWRAYENTKTRPHGIVMAQHEYEPTVGASGIKKSGD